MAERKIAICVDGGPHSATAFDWYCDNIHREGDSALLFIVCDLHVSVFADTEKVAADCKKELQRIDELKASFISKLRARKMKGEAFTLSGNKKPAEHLEDALREHSVAMVVVGTRGLGSIQRKLLGSFSDHLVHHSPVPVVVVRSPQQQ